MLKIDEFQIPVPWGHIAVKTWGEPSNYCILVLHGLMDNAGSFDTLIPLLPECFYYVCVDMPGHGLSSHFPLALPIHFLDFQVAMKLVLDYFGRDDYYVLAHSFGCRISLLTAQLYPKKIAKIVCMDASYVMAKQPDGFADEILEGHNTLMKVLSFNEDSAPSLTYEEMVNRIKVNRIIGKLNYECAEQLAARMTKQVGEDRYVFTYDRRLRSIIYPCMSAKFIQQFLKKKPVTCPGIMIMMSETFEGASKQILRRYSTQVRLRRYMVRGHHHSHHTNPELVAPIITGFFLQKKSKL